MNRVRIGYIGAGNFSRNKILPNFQSLENVELVAVSNNSTESSLKVKEEFGFSRIEDNWEDLLESTDIDAVVIGTRTDKHHEISIPSLESGKHVLVLNAMTRTVTEAKQMLDVSSAKPQLVSLIYPGQFYVQEDAIFKRLLDSGEIGKIQHIIDYWYTPFFGLGSQFEVVNRIFGNQVKLFANRTTFHQESGNTDHHGRSVRPESNIVLAERDDGSLVSYFHSTIAGASQHSKIEVYGSEGVIVCGSFQGKSYIKTGKTIDTELNDIKIDTDLKPLWDSGDSILVEKNFIDAITGDSKPSNSIPQFSDGLKLLQFAFAWKESNDNGVWVDLPTI